MSVYQLRKSKIRSIHLVDARKMAEAHPRTFKAPSDDELANIGPGDHIKVCFEHHQGGTGERIWVRVIGTLSGQWICRLANKPVFTGIDCDTNYLVSPWHVYDIKTATGCSQ